AAALVDRLPAAAEQSRGRAAAGRDALMPEPKNPAGYRIGIVKPITLVGAEVQSILRERSSPLAKTVLLATGGSAGTPTETDVQPASEFEQVGVEELAAQTISVLNVQSVPKTVFDRQLDFNLYPALEHNEEFVVAQIRGLVDARTQVALQVTQGTLFHGHTFSLFVKTDEELEIGDVEESLRANAAIALPEGDEQIGTIDAAGKDEV